MGFARLFAISLTALLVLSAAVHCESTTSFGGNITPVNLTWVQDLDRWVLFYGNITYDPQPEDFKPITINTSSANNLSQDLHLISLAPTYLVYIISEVENPFSGAYFEAANLTEFNSNHGLTGLQSSERIFNESSRYFIPSTINAFGAGSEHELPSIFFPGYNSSGYSEFAFRQGIAKTGGNYLYVVPYSPARSIDNATYDFMFILPYSMLASNNYYIYTIFAPPVPPGDTTLPYIDYTWAYDGQTLTINTVPGASISLHDELGKAYNAVADSFGVAKIDVPYGYRYSLRISASGYRSVEDVIYLPYPDFYYQLKFHPNKNLTDMANLLETADGVLLCKDGECYFKQELMEGSLQLLTEISCTGDICKFTGINYSEFVKKYEFRKVASVKYPIRLGPIQSDLFDITKFLSGLGPELSSRFGGSGRLLGDTTTTVVVSIALLLSAAVFLMLRPPAGIGRSPRGGYG